MSNRTEKLPQGLRKANACGGRVRPQQLHSVSASSNEAGKLTREGGNPPASAVGRMSIPGGSRKVVCLLRRRYRRLFTLHSTRGFLSLPYSTACTLHAPSPSSSLSKGRSHSGKGNGLVVTGQWKGQLQHVQGAGILAPCTLDVDIPSEERELLQGSTLDVPDSFHQSGARFQILQCCPLT
jgi:hypothetical protein